jgi:hypothetical protein
MVLRTQESPALQLAVPSVGGGRHHLLAEAEFGPVDCRDALLDVYVKPLRVHASQFLDARGGGYRQDARGSGCLPELVLPPEVLHRADGYVVWHSGVVRSVMGLHALLEVRVDPWPSGLELLGGGWDFHELQENDPRPLEMSVIDGGQELDPLHGSTAGSERTLTRDALFTLPGTRDLSIRFRVPPLGIDVVRTLASDCGGGA